MLGTLTVKGRTRARATIAPIPGGIGFNLTF
jgi:hypothetical protein